MSSRKAVKPRNAREGASRSARERAQPQSRLAGAIRQAMDALYWLCAFVAGLALVAIVIVVPWGVFTRYVLHSAASWPEPMAILLGVVLTFFGAAMGVRSGQHMRVTVLRDVLPRGPQLAVDLLAEALLALVALFMVVWGTRLVEATWHQVIAEFPALSVGITYLPIPIGGAITLLFIFERLAIGRPPQEADWRVSAPD
jgi:TRAP-type C4-dicarboxylate transport system permease small subunit